MVVHKTSIHKSKELNNVSSATIQQGSVRIQSEMLNVQYILAPGIAQWQTRCCTCRKPQIWSLALPPKNNYEWKVLGKTLGLVGLQPVMQNMPSQMHEYPECPEAVEGNSRVNYRYNPVQVRLVEFSDFNQLIYLCVRLRPLSFGVSRFGSKQIPLYD